MLQATARITQHVDTVAIALRAQLDAQAAFQSDLLATVHWSLGIALTIVVVLVTFSWWTNFKVYQRDLSVMRRELETHLASETGAARAALSNELTSLITQKQATLESSATTKISSLRNDVLQLKSEFYSVEYARHVQNKSMGLAATSALKLLRTGVDLGWDYQINLGLEKLTESLAAGGYLMPLELQSATELLRKVPDSFAVLRERTKQAVSTAKTSP